MNILVVAFEPFGGESINPAREAIQLLPNEIGQHHLQFLEVPTVFNDCFDVVENFLRRESIDAVVAIGQAGGRAEITPERVAINLDDARIPDNNGSQPIDRIIRQDGQPAYFSNLPVKTMTKAIVDAGIPARLSNTAGTFVCNHLFYQLGYLSEKHYPGMKFGFIHVPYVPEQVENREHTPSMALNTIAKGLEAAICAISDDEDSKLAIGELD
ncbi:pyroglutamyl-peptidase I [Staphylococcus massiliensis]|uniref:pyroglutamyl-peptidase I n=1 Tax=Staphylococcus massiliensis TaxID=555791 RepID=UPI001EDEA582|nr:pyroglutamyl-peptidase I [Staphylococcus massiliensis]MCG3402139.1 pyroglutamyl-peptidase I [Staphylococcus massiliensis]